MKSLRSKKLILAIVSIITCAVMLIGTTFAYFSDVVNVIHSITTGTYTFDLYYKDHVSGNWLKADEDDETYEFYVNDFYPGKTETFNFYVINTGSLRIDDAVISIETISNDTPDLSSQITYSWDDNEFFYKNTLATDVPTRYLGDVQPDEKEYFDFNLQFVNGDFATEKYGFNSDQSEYIGKTVVVKVRVSSKSRPTKAVSSYEKPYDVKYVIGGDNYFLDYNHGGLLKEPRPPKEDIFTFDGWYKDAGLTTPWDFGVDEITGDTTLYANWEFYFGEYPQTKVTDSGIITELNTLSGTLPTDANDEQWTSYDYQYGESSVVYDAIDYMWYQDVEYDGALYRGVYFNKYRPSFCYDPQTTDKSYQDDAGYTTGTRYWFKWEPVKWNMFDANKNTAVLMSSLIMDSRPYKVWSNVASSNPKYEEIDGENVYPSNYGYSDIRNWLNNDFYNTNFIDCEREVILNTTVDNSYENSGNTKLEDKNYYGFNTTDKVYIPSLAEMQKYVNPNNNYWVAPSDYALSQGIYHHNSSKLYWSRSPGETDDDNKRSYSVYVNLGNQTHINVNGNMGVVPMMTLDVQAYREKFKVMIGRQAYSTLEEAVTVANTMSESVTIHVKSDVQVTKVMSIKNDITITGSATITRGKLANGSYYTSNLFSVPAGKSLTVDGGIIIDGENHWTYDKDEYNRQLALRTPTTIEAISLTAEAGAPQANAIMFSVSGGSVTIGNVIIRNNYSSKNIFYLNNSATLNLNRGANIYHNYSSNNGTIMAITGTSTCTINDGVIITDNFYSVNGGLVNNTSGNLIMNGGLVTDNHGINTNGTFVILNGVGATFVMNGGTVSYNDSLVQTNGRNGTIYLHNNGRFEMNGGLICNNNAGRTGAIDAYRPSSVTTINGGTVINNTSTKEGKADIYVNVPILDNQGVWQKDGQGQVYVSGGIFTQDVNEVCIDGYIAQEIGGGKWQVVPIS